MLLVFAINTGNCATFVAVTKLEVMEGDRGKYTKDPVKVRFTTKADGRKSISFEIYQNGKRTYERLPDLFLLVETDDNSIRKNRATLNKVEKLRKQRTKELQKNPVPDKYISIKDTGQSPIMLSSWMDQYYTIQKNRGVRELSKITRTKKFLLTYSEDLELCQIDKSFCIGFSNYLKTEYKMPDGKCLSPKSGFNILCELNTALNTAVREGILVTNPFSLLSSSEKIQPVEVVREYLTIDEVKQLIRAKCGNETVKRAFLFSCNCGLRLSDVKALKWKDIYSDNGTWKVATRMKKTENIVYIPLDYRVATILDKYNGTLPKVYDQKINDHIKEIGEALGWTEIVEFDEQRGAMEYTAKKRFCDLLKTHTCRRSLATNMYKAGASLSSIMAITGHSSEQQLKTYLKLDESEKSMLAAKEDYFTKLRIAK